MIIQGTLDANGNFISPSNPIVYDYVGLIQVQGTLDGANNFVYATRQPVAFQANGSINLQGTLDANGNFVKASFRPPAVLTSDDLRIHGTVAANGSFIQPSKPLVYQQDGTNLIQGTLAANGSFIATLRGNVWNDPEPQPWSPSELFANGEQGGLYDPSDLSTVFQDTAGTIPAAFGDPVGLVLDGSSNDNSLSQSTASQRPTFLATGLRFDAVDDALAASLPQAITGDIFIAGTGGTIIEPFSGDTLTIGPTSYTGGTPGILAAIGDIVGVVLIDKTLSQVERDNLIAYYKSKGASDDIVSPTPWLIKLSNPDQPTPYFIDGWTSGDFAGFNMANPDGVTSLPTDSMLQPILEFNVTGTAGTQTLTVNSGDESKGQGNWAAVIQHDDNTYGAYMVTALDSSSCTIWPNLRADVTAKTMRNMGGSHNGQHYTEPGYKALAHRIFKATKADAYRVRYVDAWNAQIGLASDWTPVVGGTLSMMTINNVIANNSARSRWAFVSRSRRVMRSANQAPHTGKGATKTFALNGNSGMLEVFVSRADITAAGNLHSFKVVASVDGTPFHDQTYTENNGLVRVFVPFPAGSVGVVTVTATDEAGEAIWHDDVTWWVYDRLETWANRAIDINAKTVVYGDSWTTFYPSAPMQIDGILGRELQSLMAAAGGSGQVVSVGQGGQTAEWGLANFDERVLPENPKQVLILFFTNDGNQYGDNGYARWMTAMFKIGRKCQMIGANPIFIMPSQTSSFGQSIRHGIWASALGKGLRLE